LIEVQWRKTCPVAEESDANSDSDAISGPEQQRYSAYLTNPDGTTEPIPAEELSGIDAFLDSWERSTDIPLELVGSMWQGPDDAHPLGAGSPLTGSSTRRSR
jgi:hypothetical protein